MWKTILSEIEMCLKMQAKTVSYEKQKGINNVECGSCIDLEEVVAVLCQKAKVTCFKKYFDFCAVMSLHGGFN